MTIALLDCESDLAESAPNGTGPPTPPSPDCTDNSVISAAFAAARARTAASVLSMSSTWSPIDEVLTIIRSVGTLPRVLESRCAVAGWAASLGVGGATGFDPTETAPPDSETVSGAVLRTNEHPVDVASRAARATTIPMRRT